MSVAVSVHDVGKVFRGGVRALDGVSFEVERCGSMALLGANGAGKTTLLRLIGGVGRPDRGSITVDGRVGALIELGAGSHPDLTGRENAILAAVVAGLTRREARRRLDAIADFAGLADALDRPVRTYSAGMQSRLAFSVAVHVDADVLLVDEVLSVGDLAFQARSRARIAELCHAGATLLAVSHDVELAASLCADAVWLRKGKVLASGPTAEIVRRYREAVAAEATTPADVPIMTTPAGVRLVPHENRWGSMRCRLAGVEIVGGTAIIPGAPLLLTMRVESDDDIDRAAMSATLIRDDGVVAIDACETLALVPRGTTDVEVRFDRVDVAPGAYTFDVGIYDELYEERYDYHCGAYELVVVGATIGSGIVQPPVTWRARAGASRGDGRTWALGSSISN